MRDRPYPTSNFAGNDSMQRCLLCDSLRVNSFFQDRLRLFFCCENCSFVFANPHSFPSPESERQIYELHQNNPDDYRYRRFLNRLALPLQKRLGAQNQIGLDFGCGPGPTLSLMLEEMGYRMEIYDPFFYANEEVLKRQFDFVTCTEVVEHFHNPIVDFKRMLSLLRPNGLLAIMTSFVPACEEFSQWGYKNDPTHVCFFCRKSFEYLASHLLLRIDFVADGVVFFEKK